MGKAPKAVVFFPAAALWRDSRLRCNAILKLSEVNTLGRVLRSDVLRSFHVRAGQFSVTSPEAVRLIDGLKGAIATLQRSCLALRAAQPVVASKNRLWPS